MTEFILLKVVHVHLVLNHVYIVTHRRVLIEICIRLSVGLNMLTLLMLLETLECIKYIED